jgi:DNA-binding MarR family transcriptional regulator/ribosomal protein S18 acetylase RimI-like enzyme
MDAIDRIRAFNRATLRRVGAVEDAYLAEGFSLPQARVLAEIDRMDAPPARALAAALGINEGYLSRLLSGLERLGLVKRETSARDRRTRLVRLTSAGKAAADRLNAVSRERVAGWFEGAANGASNRVAQYLEAAEADLTGGTPTPIDLTPLRLGDIGWLIQAHAESYAREQGFDASFEPLVARILADFRENQDPSCEDGWIARQGDRRLGSIFCVRGPEPGLAKLRLFYLEPDARGLGLGRRMLDTCVGFAREAGYDRMTLWTHESQKAARALYRKVGFTCASARTTQSFGADVVEEIWNMTL